jgi:transcriptional regulator with XRE-family HTH domain
MAKTTGALLPATSELLVRFGERLRLARLRRQLSAKQVAERAGMVPMTLRSLERGGAGVTMGAYLSVMQVLGIERDLEQLAAADAVGRELQDARLPLARLPPPKRSRDNGPEASTEPAQKPKRKTSQTLLPTSWARDRRWVQQGGFASSTGLTDLIETAAPAAKKRR